MRIFFEKNRITKQETKIICISVLFALYLEVQEKGVGKVVVLFILSYFV